MSQPDSDKGLFRVNVTGVPTVPDDGGAFGDAGDFESFCVRERPAVERWYRHRFGLSWEDAAEVAQDAFASMSTQWSQCRDSDHRRAAFLTVAHHRLVDFMRKRECRIQPEVWLDDEETPELAAFEPTSNPAVIFGGNDGADELWEALDRLSEPCRVAVVGRVGLGLSYDELAVTTGRAPSSLRQDVARGLSLLRRRFKVPGCVVVALASLASKVRRLRVDRVPSATVAALAVLPQGALLGLLFTAPLYVLPARDAFADGVRSLPSAATALVAGPARHVSLALIAPSSPVRGPASAARQAVPLVLGRIAPPVAAAVDPPDLCLHKRCGTGERITVNVLGHEQTLPGQNQDYVELCWAFPQAAEPYVTCHRGTDPA